MSFVNNAENPGDSLLQILEKKESFCSKLDFACLLQGTVFKNDVVVMLERSWLSEH
jgi:hypothetical protein